MEIVDSLDLDGYQYLCAVLAIVAVSLFRGSGAAKVAAGVCCAALIAVGVGIAFDGVGGHGAAVGVPAAVALVLLIADGRS